MRHHHHPILTIAIWFKRHPEMTLENLCPICLQPFAIKLPVLSGAEVINFAVCSQIFGSESANAGIDAGGAALDCPQNVLPDVPVLPLCCPRQRLWAPEDRRMLPSHEGGGKTLGCALSVIDIGKFHISFCKQCCHTGVLVLSMAVRPWWLMCPQGTVNGVAWLVTCVKQ